MGGILGSGGGSPVDPLRGVLSAVEAAGIAEAARVAAEQDPLLRRKHLQVFEVLDVDRDGFVTPADTHLLARRFAAITPGGEQAPITRQLTATIDRIWHALVIKPRWVPDVERLDREQFVTVMANSVATTPDKTLQYIAVVTNLTFTMADTDHDGVLSREESIRLRTAVLEETRDEAVTRWNTLPKADPELVTYAELLVAVTDFLTGVDPESSVNLVLGRL